MLKALNCGMEAVCVVISGILLVQLQTAKVKRDTDRWFKLALIGNLGVLPSDILVWVYSGNPAPGARILMLFANPLFFFFSSVYMFGIFVYVYTYMNGKKPQHSRMLKVGAAVSVLHILFVATSPFTGAAFSISPSNTYLRGPLWILIHLAPAVIFVMVLWIYGRTWSLLNRKEKLWFSLYYVFELVGMVMQGVYGSICFEPLMFTLTMLMINMFIHSEMDEQLRTAEQRLERERIQALQALQRKQTELTDEIIIALSNTVEAKDHYTNGHSQRVAAYATEIVRRMGWSEEDREKVYYTGLLHDVGKIRVPDTIINKTSRLDDDELAQIKLHTMAGYYILKEISSVGEFAIGARWHHERYDGTGYPNGLSGSNIPQIARIIAVADAYDAMTSNRSYREIMPQARVRRELADGAGTQFDPEIVSIMLQMIDEDAAYRLRQPDPTVERIILSIDDDPLVHKLLELLFRSQPLYKLRSASTGEEGLEILKKEAVDLVLLDVEMPGMNGFDVLTHIREDRRSTPVIFMTGDKDIDIIQKAEQLGISDYLTKPLVAHMLMESVQNVLISSQAMRRAEPFAEGGREHGE